jgi:hypothetical protein
MLISVVGRLLFCARHWLPLNFPALSTPSRERIPVGQK